MKTRIGKKATGLLITLILAVAGFCVVPLMASAAENDSAKPVELTEKASLVAGATENDSAKPVEYTAELDTIAVKVAAPADAFSEEVDLVVKQLGKDDEEFAEAEEALAENNQTYDGILAFDIHFENVKGEEVEPSGKVSVEMTAKEAAFEGVDPEAVGSVQVTHISDEATVVADSVAAGAEGTVEVQATEEAVEKVDAEFEVDGFSTYAITWKEGEEEKSATIHWVTTTEDGIEEIDSTTAIDETAASVDLAVNIDGYYFTGAKYRETASGDEVVMDSSVIKKNDDNLWTVDITTYDDDDNPTITTELIADGSDIFVYYAEKGGGGYNPPGPPPAALDDITPETGKTVTPNNDGTYKIRLDITGHATEDTKQGANVIVMLDMTYSMRQNDMNGTRIAAAKSALLTLIDALNPGYDAQHPDLNLVNFTLATFGNTMTTSTELSWTQDRTDMESAVRGLSNSPGAMGTNWQGGLGGAETLAEAANSNPDLNKNPTYVIFVTDGAPNCWRGHTSSSTGNDLDPAALPYAQDAANSLTKDAILYGVFCGPASGYDNLANMVTAANGAGTINGTNPDDLQAAFSQIAGHIVAGMAAGNVTVDDGIPSLSNVSANVTAGEAGAFTYYIKPEGESEAKEWVKGATGETDPGAPGATYDKSNGVTWDLGEVGTLQEGWVYSVEFTVWPSQEAYDTIADLNNGIKTMTQAELDAAGIGKNPDGTYYLLTNTHLNTTFEDPTGHVYDVVEQNVVSEAMALPTETIGVKKIWNNFIDQQNPPAGVKLILTRDEKDYLYGENAVEVSSSTSWEKDDIFISLGQIKSTSDGYEILETGHDYEIVEPEDYTGDYRWELTSEVYHPMVIDGTATMLIKDDEATGTDGSDYYTLGEHKYKVADASGNMLQAWNDRRSWLQIGKNVEGKDAPEDALFEFTATITDANGDDIWYSVYSPEGIVKDLTTSGTAEIKEGEKTGYYYSASGNAITVEIQAGWTLRFLNLPSGTTYTIDETGFPDGFAFDSVEDDQVVDTGAVQDDPEKPTIDGKTVSGTINVPNVEFYVDYTNKYEETEVTATKVWDDANNQDGKRDDVTFVLYANGEAVANSGKTIAKDATGDDLKVEWQNLPAYKNGGAVDYTVKEDGVDENNKIDMNGAEYTVTVAGSAANGFTITNAHEPEKTKITVTKKWEGDESFQNLRPENVEVHVLADGTALTEVGTLNAGNDWTYTWDNLPIKNNGTDIEYALEEVEVDNYTTVVGDLVKGEDGFWTAEITNTLETGDLEVTKSVVSDLAADASQEFSFTVKLSDTSISGTYGDMTFEDGVADFKLTDGESAKAEGLPTGLTYTVEETANDDFTTKVNGEVGTSVADQQLTEDGAAVAFENTRKTGDLEVKKTVVSDLAADASQEFSFTVKLSDTSISGTYGDMTFEDGVADLTLTDGQSAKAEGLPTGLTYTVEETANNDFTTKVNGEVGTSVADQKLTENGAAVAFENTRKTGDLTVKKVLVSDLTADKDVEFAIKVTLGDNTINKTYSGVEFKSGVATVKLKGGESKTIEGLPTNVTYTITEEVPDGFTATYTDEEGTISTTASEATVTNTRKTGDLTVKKALVSDLAADKDVEFTITVTLGDTSISGTYGGMEFTSGVATLTLKGGDSATATGLPTDVTYTITEATDENFTTTYSGKSGTISTTAAAATVTNTRKTGDLEVTKTVTSSTAADKTKKFEFTVTLDDTSISGTYGGMEFTEGVATFTLADGESAKAEGLPAGITYTVAETAVDGFVTIPEGGTSTGTISTEASTAEFSNVKKEGGLVVTKTVTVPEGFTIDKNKEFTFTVTLDDTSISGTYGDMTFENGVATFTLKHGEFASATGLPAGVGYTVDETAADGYTVEKTGETGTVEDDGTATAAFINAYNAESVNVDPPVCKIIKNNDELYNKGDFTFTIKGPAGAPMPEKTSITNVADNELKDRKGYYEFGVITFDKPGTYTYIVTESGSVANVTNDSEASKELKFTVTDNGDGTLSVSPTTDDAAWTFTNVYNEPVKNPAIEIEKIAVSEPKNGEYYQEGETIKYEITVANTGDVDLTEVVVADDLTGDEWTVDKLAVGETKTFKTSYKVTKSDVEAGEVANQATVTAKDPDGKEITEKDKETVKTGKPSKNTPVKKKRFIPRSGDTLPIVGLLAALAVAAGALVLARRRMASGKDDQLINKRR